MSILAAMQSSPIGEWVRSSDYGYYILLAVHAIGMGIVVGTVMMLTIRVLGFAKDQPLLQYQTLFGVAWAGFFVNFASGAGLFMANGENLAKNVPFLLKITFIVIGGVSQWLLWRTLMQEREIVVDANGPASIKAKSIAIFTVSCWIFAIMAGRIIGYTIDY